MRIFVVIFVLTLAIIFFFAVKSTDNLFKESPLTGAAIIDTEAVQHHNIRYEDGEFIPDILRIKPGMLELTLTSDKPIIFEITLYNIKEAVAPDISPTVTLPALADEFVFHCCNGDSVGKIVTGQALDEMEFES